MNFAMNYYGPVEQAEKHSIKPYRFPEFCVLFLILPFVFTIALPAIGDLFNSKSQTPLSGNFIFLIGGLLFFFLIFRSFSIMFFGTGTISINDNGFTVQGLFNNQHFTSWEDMPEFFLSSAGSRSFHEYVTVRSRQFSRYQIRYIGYPISNADLCDYLSRTYQLAIHTKPLEDYSRYKKMSNWCTFTTITNIIFAFFMWLGVLATLLQTN